MCGDDSVTPRRDSATYRNGPATSRHDPFGWRNDSATSRNGSDICRSGSATWRNHSVTSRRHCVTSRNHSMTPCGRGTRSTRMRRKPLRSNRMTTAFGFSPRTRSTEGRRGETRMERGGEGTPQAALTRRGAVGGTAHRGLKPAPTLMASLREAGRRSRRSRAEARRTGARSNR